MIQIETDNSVGKIFKSIPIIGLESQRWEVRNDTNFAKLKLKSAHFHNEFQIGYLSRGFLENSYRGVKEIITPNQLYLIKPEEIHAENSLSKETLLLNFVFIPRQLMTELILATTNESHSDFKFEPLLINNKSLNNFLLDKFKTLAAVLENKSSEIEQTAYLFDFMESLTVIFRSEVFAPHKKKQEKKMVKFVKEYLRENLTESISLETLAKETYTSKFHLLRQFTKETGLTIHRYLIQLRICEAKEFLKSGKSIAQTAFELGFNDQAHFTKCFKRFTSQTPKQFYNPKKSSTSA
jgi:AraC-like DNA-binding protein